MSKTTYDVCSKIWRGPTIKPIYNPDQNLGHLILQLFQQTPKLVTQISAETNVSLTCEEMYKRTIKIAKFLLNSGLKEGDIVGLVTANTENLAPVVFACFTLGLPINPLSPIMNEKDIEQMFGKIKPKMIFCDASNLKVVQNSINELNSDAKILTVMDKINGYGCVCEILEEMKGESISDFEFPDINPNSTAAILCSSGSTGFPKGICKSHKQIISNFLAVWKNEHKGTQVFLQASAIFWLSGFYALITSAFYGCIRVMITRSIEAELLQDTINKFNVTIAILPPYALVSFLQFENFKPLKSIQSLIVGGAVVSNKLCQQFKPFIPNGNIHVLYGSTEEDFLSANYTNRNYGSSGFVRSNVELKVIDDDGNALGPNESGEIYSKIPVQFSGYFDEPDSTKSIFDGDWFKTGDIGYFDCAGYLYVIERKKELLKFRNFQVTPSEITSIINEIQGVTSSCVVGVPEPDTGNDIIHAFVIVNEFCDLSEKFIAEYVNKKVIDPKRIRGGVHIVETFPLGMTGKVDTKKLREIAKKFM